MMRVAVKIAYLGCDFSGSQIQPGVRTVEGDVLSNLKMICRRSEEELDLHLASRTDSGVNALGNVAVFNTDFEDFGVLLKALNAISKGVFYRSIAVVGEDFNPRFADERRYRYVLPAAGIDAEKASECADLFLGEHDFARFCRANGKSTIMSMDSIDVSRNKDLIVIDFSARYYLWNMIRRIVAAIMSVGMGNARIEDVRNALDGRDMTFGLARPDALTLVDVVYEDLEFEVPSDDMFDTRVKEEMFRNDLRMSFFTSL